MDIDPCMDKGAGIRQKAIQVFINRVIKKLWDIKQIEVASFGEEDNVLTNKQHMFRLEILLLLFIDVSQEIAEAHLLKVVNYSC